MLLAENRTHGAMEEVTPPFSLIRTGGWSLVPGLMAWFKEGSLRFASAVASDIIQVVYNLESQLSCPIISRALPRDFLDDAKP